MLHRQSNKSDENIRTCRKLRQLGTQSNNKLFRTDVLIKTWIDNSLGTSK